MTVKELRELLIDYPDDMLIVLDALKGGYNSFDQNNIENIDIVLNYGTEKNSHIFGIHRDISDFPNPDGLEVGNALKITI